MRQERFPAEGDELAGNVLHGHITEPYTAASASHTKPEMVQGDTRRARHPTGRGNAEPSPRPIRARLEDGPRGRLRPGSLPYSDTALCPTSAPRREQI